MHTYLRLDSAPSTNQSRKATVNSSFKLTTFSDNKGNILQLPFSFISHPLSLSPMSASNSRISLALFVFFANFPGLMLCAVVSLSSIEMFERHEWLKVTTTVYFLCEGENKNVFEDVKRPRFVYAYHGQQSWQILSNFSSKNCKWCGLYEENSITSDDAFDEWEFCPSDFTAPRGEYVRFKEKQFNATFLCPDCLSFGASSSSDKRGKHIVILVFLGALASIILILGVFGTYKFWLKKRKEEDQAQFLKLFEDGDDIEDELGLGGTII